MAEPDWKQEIQDLATRVHQAINSVRFWGGRCTREDVADQIGISPGHISA